MKNKKVSVVTLGCSKNTVDSERLINQIVVNNIEYTDNPLEAGTVILNTCGFIDAAKEESVQEILKAVKLKNEGKLDNVIVAGCLSERYMDELIDEIPEVDHFFGTEEYEGIIKSLGGKVNYELLGERNVRGDIHSAYLKISEGCDNPCSFCAIPLMRGKHKSLELDFLLGEAKSLVNKGAKELVIIGQDTTDWGKDLSGNRNTAYLLNKLSEIDGLQWIRLMYAYPSHFPDELIETIAANEKICKYIDIPLQHISDKVLKSMRRGITKRRTLELLEKLREKIPALTLRTTFITGYPAEGKDEFNELLDFVNEFIFDRLGVFSFSVEENTTSYILGDPVSGKEKNRRKRAIMEAQKEISAVKNKNFLNKEITVLIDRFENGQYFGRTYMDAPEVDGETILDRTRLILKPGDFVNALVYDCSEYDFFAEIKSVRT